MNEQKLKDSIQSASTRKLNPHLFRNQSGVGGQIPKRFAPPPLDKGKKEQGRSPGCVVEVCFLSLRRAEVDDDNLAGAYKPLRDVIAEYLRIDDGDPRIKWRYAQAITRSKPSTIVVINML